MSKDQETIKIYCRLRPSDDDTADYKVTHEFDDSMIEIRRPKRQGLYIDNTLEKFTFKFNGIFEPMATQEEVFDRCAKACINR